MMNKEYVKIFFLLAFFMFSATVFGTEVPSFLSGKISSSETLLDSLYSSITPGVAKPSFAVFSAGLTGYFRLFQEGKLKNTRYLSLIDFTLTSRMRRLWVIDLFSMKIIHHSLVAHGKNTGEEYAVTFSNIPNSNKSCLGFFITGSTYYGKHGLSLTLDGIEKDINDNARKRAIVIHPAEYATNDFIDKHGRLGRSFGCPALPPSISKEIIDTIKGSSCLFIYYPDEGYLSGSSFMTDEVY